MTMRSWPRPQPGRNGVEVYDSSEGTDCCPEGSGTDECERPLPIRVRGESDPYRWKARVSVQKPELTAPDSPPIRQVPYSLRRRRGRDIDPNSVAAEYRCLKAGAPIWFLAPIRRNVGDGSCAPPPTSQIQASLRRREIDFNDLSGLHEVDRRGDSRCNSPQGRPVVRGEDDKSQFTIRKVLLILDVLIAGKQQIEPRLFSRVQQRAVLQPLPSHLIRPYHLMSPRNGRAAPACWRRTGSSRSRVGLLKGTLGKGKHAMHLFPADGWEPLQELAYG